MRIVDSMKMIFDAFKSALSYVVCSPYFWALFICIFVVLPSSVGLQYPHSKKGFIISLIFFILFFRTFLYSNCQLNIIL